jgi:hypothetical protein
VSAPQQNPNSYTHKGDVELLERRYPVFIHQFGLRHGSGGTGKFRGGEGVIRELEVLEPMQVSILSEVPIQFALSLFARYLHSHRGAPANRTAWTAAAPVRSGATPG